MVVFPHGNAPSVAVVPIGDPETTACEAVAETLRETFEIPVAVHNSVKAPVEDASRGDAGEYLEYVSEACGEGTDLAIGVTAAPLDLRLERSLFGVAVDAGETAVLSTYRLVDGDDDLTAVERERIEKEIKSLAGKLFSLRTHRDDGDEPHRDDDPPRSDGNEPPSCVMEAGDDLRRMDAAPETYCDECWTALTDASSYPKPPKPDGWSVRSREYESFQTAARWARGDTTWRDYPWMALGYVVVTLEEVGKRLRPLVRALPTDYSARDLPQSVHTFYRVARFWGNIVLYLVTIFLWLVALVSAYELLLGSAPSDTAALAVFAASLLVGVVSVWIVKGIASGAYFVLREVSSEGIE